MPVSELKAAPYNPRRIDAAAMAALTKSIERFGYVEHIVFNKRSGFVVGGHQRLKVLRASKIKEIPVVIVDLAENEEKALNIALNSPHLAGTFTDNLQALLAEIHSKDEILFSELRLDQLLSDVKKSFGVKDADEIPPPPKIAKTKQGDLYELGRHRLLCGDSTSSDDVARLLNGHKAALSLTDPPYSVGYSVSFSKRERNGKNVGTQDAYKESKDARPLMKSILNMAPDLVIMTYPVDRHFFDLSDALRESKFESVRELVWVKNSPTFHPGAAYQQMHEPIIVIRRENTPYPKTIPSDAKTVLTVDRPSRHEDHPTEKPISLWSDLLVWHSNISDIIHEPFGGSGTTIISCEMHHRVCYAMELAPEFCDVIVQRWEEFTGKKAVLQRGES